VFRPKTLLGFTLALTAACLLTGAALLWDGGGSADGPNPYALLGAGILALGAVGAFVIAVVLIASDRNSTRRRDGS